MVPYIFLISRKYPHSSLGTALALFSPLLFLLLYLLWFSPVQLFDFVSSELSNYVKFPDIIQTFGLLPFVFSVIGIFSLFITMKINKMGLLLGLIFLLLYLLLFFRFGIGSSIIYERGLVYLILLLSITAGAGLSWLSNLKLKTYSEKTKIFTTNIGKKAVIISAIIIMLVIVPARINANFYHMIDYKDYSNFTWIRKNLDQNYDTFLIDPWKATAFTAITGRFTARRIYLQREPIDDRIDLMLEKGCQDLSFIRDNNISAIYNIYECNNTELNKINNNVYIVNSYPFNNLQNAGFEGIVLKDAAPWVTWYENCNPQFLFPQPGMDDGQSIGIKLPPDQSYNTWPQAMWSQTVPVNPGNKYYISGWLKTENVSGIDGARILVYWRGQDWEAANYTEIMENIQGTTDWSFHDGFVVAPAEATSCSVICIMAGCSGNAWFDNLEFYEK